MIVGTESLVFIDQTLISVIEFRLRHLHAIKKKGVYQKKRKEKKREKDRAYHSIKNER